MCYAERKEIRGDPDCRVTAWNPWTETLDDSRDFCSNCIHDSPVAPGVSRYRCLGHLTPEDIGTVEQEEKAGDPHGEGEPLEDMALPSELSMDDSAPPC